MPGNAPESVGRKYRLAMESVVGFKNTKTTIDAVCSGNERYWLTVHENGIGLYRMSLADRHQIIGIPPERPGYVVRELYTYQPKRMETEAQEIMTHGNPPAYCVDLITEWNCAKLDGPISLDSKKSVRVAFVPNQPPLDSDYIESVEVV